MEVLIAHSSEVSRRALEGALAGLDIDFIEASDGARALEVLMRADPPRLALIEWDLSDIEGPELCRLLRDFHLGHAPYVILLTPEAADRDVTAGLVAGASDFVCTPASARELRARVEYGLRVVELPWGRAAIGREAAEPSLPADDGARAELSAMLSDQWASALGF